MFGRRKRLYPETVYLLDTLALRTPNFCRVDGARLVMRDVSDGYDEFDGHERRKRWLTCANWTGEGRYKRYSYSLSGALVARLVDCNGLFASPKDPWAYSETDYLTCEPELEIGK